MNWLHEEIGVGLMICGAYIMAIGGVLRALQAVIS